MKCKFCGAKIKGDSLICPNCGKSAVEDEYLFARYVSKSREKEHKVRLIVKRTILVVISIAVIASLIISTYLITENHHQNIQAPNLQFVTGTGLVNDEKVIYLTIEDSSSIQYIHGVNLYEGKVNASTDDKGEIISSDYEYTKDSSDSIRSIFFYTDDLKLDKKKSYTYTFEMTFGFSEDINSYTYYQPISFKGDIKNDLSDVVFDHRMDDDIENDFFVSTTKHKEQTETTEDDPDKYRFIFDGYWYSQPRRDGDTMSLDVWSFDSNDTATRITYTKKGNASWKTETVVFSFNFDGAKGFVQNNSVGEAYNMTISTLSRMVDLRKSGEIVDTLEYRRHNSIENVEDSFGL